MPDLLRQATLVEARRIEENCAKILILAKYNKFRTKYADMSVEALTAIIDTQRDEKPVHAGQTPSPASARIRAN